MRVTLSTNDAPQLEAQMRARPTTSLKIQPVDSEGKVVMVGVEGSGVTFRGEARPTPSAPGAVVIEDATGRIIARAE